jgi:hypothetical protein
MSVTAPVANIRVSLTRFVDLIITTGTPRITCVKEIKAGILAGYEPAKDFWKILRDGIIDFHHHALSTDSFNSVIQKTSDLRRLAHYDVAIKLYLRWLGRRKATWEDLRCTNFIARNVEVHVHPELGLNFNNDIYAIKLYFKKEPLKKRAIDPILYLLENYVTRQDGQPITPAILDLPNGRLLTPTNPLPNLASLLEAEVAAFSVLYSSI